MPAMVARSRLWVRCTYGCCDPYKMNKHDRRTGKRMIKRAEDQEWMREMEEDLAQMQEA